MLGEIEEYGLPAYNVAREHSAICHPHQSPFESYTGDSDVGRWRLSLNGRINRISCVGLSVGFPNLLGMGIFLLEYHKNVVGLYFLRSIA